MAEQENIDKRKYLHSLADLYMALAVQKLLDVPTDTVERAIAEAKKDHASERYCLVTPSLELYMSITELAQTLRVKPMTVRRLIKQGRLGVESEWFGKRRFFSRKRV